MRMRKKKNLDTRLENVRDYILDLPLGDERDFNKAIEEKSLIDYKEIFGNDNPVRMEIGCGRGQFAMEIAKRHPDINFIAVEKVLNVIVLACEKAKREGLTNIKFICGSAEYLPKFIPEKSIELLYLNFSCPYPKARYARHRLTHRFFLDIYRSLLKDGAEIHQKTDNMHFFEFSVAELSQSGWKIKNVSLDLHNSDFEGNIVTEYEKRFSDLGQPIYRLEAWY
ncbi:MAG: tRNA (guanosine(46)-N7)-methyltransferase TrmB [Ruminococcaceae bacterium]|nr:tRNA (guanosine(46)-N7)-methyltransferase TrmB [Oscillospiraceae bacterium]MBQ9913272.1 tRNA (guanosine(46)-N7)-methyltransferase TrmB [Clostridia bacterium]